MPHKLADLKKKINRCLQFVTVEKSLFEMQKQRTKNCKDPSYGYGAINQNVQIWPQMFLGIQYSGFSQVLSWSPWKILVCRKRTLLDDDSVERGPHWKMTLPEENLTGTQTSLEQSQEKIKEFTIKKIQMIHLKTYSLKIT